MKKIIEDEKRIDDEDKLNRIRCRNCTACCKYINVPIDAPQDEDDADYLLWCLLHKNVHIWIGKNKRWFIKFMTPCKPLKKGACGRYKTRPMICREYLHEECEKLDLTKDEMHSFHNQDELLSYLKKKKVPFFGFYD